MLLHVALLVYTALVNSALKPERLFTPRNASSASGSSTLAGFSADMFNESTAMYEYYESIMCEY